MVDHLFLLAIGAIGWGASLVSYRVLATRCGWPLGALQTSQPAIPILMGAVAIAAGGAFAAARGPTHGGLVILLFGLALAVFWSGFLRVGAQTALVLAPLAAAGLLVAWIAPAL